VCAGPALGGWESYAKAINDAGQVVGYSWLTKGGRHAFLFSNGKLLDLNSLISPESHLELLDAWAINNRGQILGVGINDQGVGSLVLLTPVEAPEPASLTLLGIGAASLAGYAWRKRKRLTRCAPCTAAAPTPGRAP
jgi:probable HAF family extracellular repeat protein